MRILAGIYLAIATLALSPTSALAQSSCPAGVRYPDAQWESAIETTRAARATEIAALEQRVFTLTGEDDQRLGVRTDSVLILHRGVLVYERYGRTWTAEQPHYTWSMTKSLTNVLTGIAVGRGYLNLSDSLCRWMPYLRMDMCALTVQHPMEFATGLDWRETYENASNQESSVLAMLYGVGHHDAAGFVGSHPFRDRPGTTYMYSSGDTNLLSRAVDRAYSAAGEDSEYPWRYVFDPLGITSATLERDASGTPIGSSYWYATPRDLARFGYFLLRDGCWRDQRILPEGWVRTSTEVSAPQRIRRLDADADDVQGRQFWLNRPVPEQGVTTPWPGVPEDTYAARGHWGQSITVIPSRELVIVRTADDRVRGFDFAGFIAAAMAVAP
ncbi:MAG: serine hydrolase [Deltaproteobacteria bacterium]|nr:serine hydrolase [Deltaproteobacteria bacterium]